MVRRSATKVMSSICCSFVTTRDRCHWCKLLDPVWQQTAEQLPDQPFAKDVRMAKVDCEANGQLCQEHSIRAYPTIQVYMHGENSESLQLLPSCQKLYAAENALTLRCSCGELQLPLRLTTEIVRVMRFLPGWATSTKFWRPSRPLPRLLRATHPHQQQTVQMIQPFQYECMLAARRVSRVA